MGCIPGARPDTGLTGRGAAEPAGRAARDRPVSLAACRRVLGLAGTRFRVVRAAFVRAIGPLSVLLPENRAEARPAAGHQDCNQTDDNVPPWEPRLAGRTGGRGGKAEQAAGIELAEQEGLLMSRCPPTDNYGILPILPCGGAWSLT